MIDDKPVTIQFHNAWSCFRLMVQPQPEVPQMGYPGVPPGYDYPLFYPFPSWGTGCQTYSSDSLQPPGHASGMPPFGRGTPLTSANTTRSPSLLPANSTDRNPPDIEIVSWFSFLDSNAQSSKDNQSYTRFGPRLRDEGFIHVSQLTTGFVELSELQDWLGVKRGMAILIMQYAKQDLNAIRSGS